MTAGGATTEEVSTTYFTTDGLHTTYSTTQNPGTTNLITDVHSTTYSTEESKFSDFTTKELTATGFATEKQSTTHFITNALRNTYSTSSFTASNPNTSGHGTTNFITDIVGTSGYNTKESTQSGFTTDDVRESDFTTEESNTSHTQNPKTIKPTTKAQNISGYSTKESIISELTAQTSDFQTEMTNTIHSVVTASSKHTLDASSALPTPTQNASLTTLNNTLSPSDYTETFSSTQHGPTITPLTLSQTASLLLSEPVYSSKVSVDGPDTTATSLSAHSVSTSSLTTSRMASLERTINVLSDSTSSSTPSTSAATLQPTPGQIDLSSSPRTQNTATTSFFHDPTTLVILPAITSTDATESFTDSPAISLTAFTLSSGDATYTSPTFASSTVNQRTTTVLSNSVAPLSSLVSGTTQSVGTLRVYTSATTPTGLPTSITTSAHFPFVVTQTTTLTSSSRLSPALPLSSTITHSSTTSLSTLLTTSSSSAETTTTLLSTSLPLTSPSNTFSPALSNSVLSSTHIQTDTASSTKVPQTLASTSTSIAFQSSPAQSATYTPLVSISSSTTNHPASSSVSQNDKTLSSATSSKEMSSTGFPTSSISSSLSSSKSSSTTTSQTTTIMSNATTSTTTTTSISPPVNEPNDRTFAIDFTIININFTSDLSNPNSTLYKELEYNITLQLTTLYKKCYLGSLFKYVKVNGFRKGSVIVDCTCVFSTNNSLHNVSTLLNGTSVKDIFISALNGSNDLGVMYLINPKSLTVQEQTTTTSTVTTTTVSTTSMTNIPVTDSSDKRFIINFTIINLNFTSDLNKPSSALYKNLETNITAQLTLLYKNSELSNIFKYASVKGFSKGSVKVSSVCVFSSSPILSLTLVKNIFVSGTNNSSLFGGLYQLDPSSVSVEEDIIDPLSQSYVPYWAIILICLGITLILSMISFLGYVTVRSKWYGRRGSYDIMQMPQNLPYTRLK
ncbi:serine-rich adhesin for platelets-like isoform X12 [Erpetoichthys calabaricus]|nr:serine-rich adhesin for platelets-like isoform X11 [Erpetoichthys calabaricus]XP_051791214.1 serine-rich adhesin for platelets-like isoform X12 [Erpetoichthys calabaricus]